VSALALPKRAYLTRTHCCRRKLNLWRLGCDLLLNIKADGSTVKGHKELLTSTGEPMNVGFFSALIAGRGRIKEAFMVGHQRDESGMSLVV